MPGQHQVEHDQIGTLVGHQLQRLRAVAGDPGPVPGPLQVARDDLGDRRLVVDDQHRAAGVILHDG